MPLPTIIILRCAINTVCSKYRKVNFIMESLTELSHSIPPLPSPFPMSPHTTSDLDLTPEKENPQQTTKEIHWDTKTKSRALKVIFTINVVNYVCL